MSRRSLRIFAFGGALSGGLFGLMLAPFSFPNPPMVYAALCVAVLIASAAWEALR